MKNLKLKGVKFNNLPSKELGYLIGLFDGDGYTNKHTGHYDVQFFLNSLKDEDIKEYLLSILKKISLHPRVTKDKRFNCLKIEVSNKLFYEFMLKFSTNNLENKNFKLGYISGVVDSDGYVNKIKRYIQITNTDIRLMRKVQRYLKILNVESKITKKSKCIKDRLQRYSIYVPMKFLNTQNNSMKIKRI